MILLTRGLGFIGSHAARALLDLGEDVVVTRHDTVDMPDFLNAELGRRLFVEPADVADPDALKAIGRRYPIDGVLHLATAALSERDLAADVRTNVSGVLTVVRAASSRRPCPTQRWIAVPDQQSGRSGEAGGQASPAIQGSVCESHPCLTCTTRSSRLTSTIRAYSRR